MEREYSEQAAEVVIELDRKQRFSWIILLSLLFLIPCVFLAEKL